LLWSNYFITSGHYDCGVYQQDQEVEDFATIKWSSGRNILKKKQITDQ